MLRVKLIQKSKSILLTEDEPATKRMKADKVTPNLAAPFRPADLSNVSQSSECFAGKELCVLNGEDGMSKQELERLVAGGGGELVQYPGEITASALLL